MEEFWTFNRLGIVHMPSLILQPQLPLIKVGRASDQDLQLKGILIFSCLKIAFKQFKKKK